MHRLGGILSQFTLKVSGQFALAGKGDAGGEDMGLLENEVLWSSGMHADICLGGAEMDTGSGMGKILHLYGSISRNTSRSHFCIEDALCSFTFNYRNISTLLCVIYNQITISTFATGYCHMCRPGVCDSF